LVFLTGLTACDYLLWNWSLNTNHDVLALISGLTLPPLVAIWLWALALGAARFCSSLLRRPADPPVRPHAGIPEPTSGADPIGAASRAGSSGKIAA
jgi:hypothetical protein